MEGCDARDRPREHSQRGGVDGGGNITFRQGLESLYKNEFLHKPTRKQAGISRIDRPRYAHSPRELKPLPPHTLS